MNLNYSILTERANAALAPRAPDDAKFWKVIGQGLGAEEFLALLGIAALGIFNHGGEAISKEGNLEKVIHRIHELSHLSPQFYQQVLLRIVAFLFGNWGELA